MSTQRIVTNSLEELQQKLEEMGIHATGIPHRREFSVTQGLKSVDVLRLEVSECADLDLGLFTPAGSVLWMIEGIVDKGAIEDVQVYLDAYIQMMRNNEEQPIAGYTWAQILGADEYAHAIAQLEAWRAEVDE